MNRYKRYLPIVAALLIAAGVSLERYGIDLHALATGETTVAVPRSADATGGRSGDPGRDSTAFGEDGARAVDYPAWSDTTPNINLRHVFEGEINRSGKPVGYHARPGGRDPAGARLVAVSDPPDRAGVYTARVEIRDGNRWLEKRSSFFPDALSRDEVIDAILNAYHESPAPDAQPFEGPSGLGFPIQGYTSSRGGISTAYPIRARD